MAGDVSQSEENGPIAAINVTPFVDVVLVLLVVFIATAPIIIKDTFKVKLPQAQTGDGTSAQVEDLTVSISKDGALYMNGKPITEEVLRNRTLEIVKKTPNLQAIISADTDSKHGSVVKIIDLMKGAGLSRFAIEIEKTR